MIRTRNKDQNLHIPPFLPTVFGCDCHNMVPVIATLSSTGHLLRNRLRFKIHEGNKKFASRRPEGNV